MDGLFTEAPMSRGLILLLVVAFLILVFFGYSLHLAPEHLPEATTS